MKDYIVSFIQIYFGLAFICSIVVIFFYLIACFLVWEWLPLTNIDIGWIDIRVGAIALGVVTLIFTKMD